MEKDTINRLYIHVGCSDIAPLANYITVECDRKGIAEMSCIAGVGCGVKPLEKNAVRPEK